MKGLRQSTCQIHNFYLEILTALPQGGMALFRAVRSDVDGRAVRGHLRWAKALELWHRPPLTALLLCPKPDVLAPECTFRGSVSPSRAVALFVSTLPLGLFAAAFAVLNVALNRPDPRLPADSATIRKARTKYQIVFNTAQTVLTYSACPF